MDDQPFFVLPGSEPEVIIHQSDLSSWARCPHATYLARAGHRQTQTSALSYGTVMHYALEQFEREWRTGNKTWAAARDLAVETFRHYWNPMRIEAICAPVEQWLPMQTYNSLDRRGAEAIAWYCQWAKNRDEELLATEYGFSVPIENTWDDDLDEPHRLNGTIDRLSSTFYKMKPVLEVGDHKTGKDHPYLRQHIQFTAYAYASTRREFWLGDRGEDGFGDRGEALYQRFKTAGRKGTWISLKNGKAMDAGWRGEDDYARFAVAVEQLVASMKAEIYPLSITGENCTFCTYKQFCAGVGVPADDHGAPA